MGVVPGYSIGHKNRRCCTIRGCGCDTCNRHVDGRRRYVGQDHCQGLHRRNQGDWPANVDWSFVSSISFLEFRFFLHRFLLGSAADVIGICTGYNDAKSSRGAQYSSQNMIRIRIRCACASLHQMRLVYPRALDGTIDERAQEAGALAATIQPVLPVLWCNPTTACSVKRNRHRKHHVNRRAVTLVLE